VKSIGTKIWRPQSLPPYWSTRGRIPREEAQLLKSRVKPIIEKVRAKQDAALIEYTRKFDKVSLDPEKLLVTARELKEAYRKVSEDQISAIKSIKQRVEAFEQRILDQMRFQLRQNGLRIETVTRPIESVGCYVPGGNAAYPSTAVMTVVPAKVAGVSRVVMCSPPTAKGTINPLTLVAADICKVHEVYKIGGAQAIAALAYGTESIKPVKKIVGPGNRYVTMAKILVSRDIAIDMPAGPSEILILADETANSRFIALDMISQAEHGPDSIAGLMTTSDELAEDVLKELERAVSSSKRSATILNALSNHGFLVICKTISEMVRLANDFAPEHLQIVTREPERIADKVTTAGLILIGPYSPVSASDYCYGTNHVLPTSGYSHTYSGLSVLDFVKRIGVVECSKDGLLALKNMARVVSEAENLPNHYAAIEGRFELEE